MKITAIHTSVQPYSTGTWLDSASLSTPMASVPRFRERRSSWRGPGADVCWVLVETDAPEVFGIGQTRGGVVAESIISSHLAKIVRGEDPRVIGTRTFEMNTALLPYASGAMAAMAVSAIELALWDLAARAAGLSLASMLGGRPRELEYYLTIPDEHSIASVDADLLAGALCVKVPAHWGPTDSDGVERTIADLSRVRSVVPNHVPIAIDAWMSWSRSFALRVIDAADDLGLGWIEEPLLPSDLSGYRSLSRSTRGASITGGEHTYGLTDGTRFIDESGVGIYQPDVTWCGGLSTAKRMHAHATARHVGFAPHAGGSQPWARHLLASLEPGSLAEVMVLDPESATRPRAEDVVGVGLSPAEAGFR